MTQCTASLKAIPILALAAIALAACAADPGYDPAVAYYDTYPPYAYPYYGYPAYGFFDFEYSGGHWDGHRDDHWDRHGGHR